MEQSTERKKENTEKLKKEDPVDLLIIFTLKYSPQSYYIYIGLLKSRRVTLLRQGKDENKRKGMAIVNKIRYRGCII